MKCNQHNFGGWDWFPGNPSVHDPTRHPLRPYHAWGPAVCRCLGHVDGSTSETSAWETQVGFNGMMIPNDPHQAFSGGLKPPDFDAHVPKSSDHQAKELRSCLLLLTSCGDPLLDGMNDENKVCGFVWTQGSQLVDHHLPPEHGHTLGFISPCFTPTHIYTIHIQIYIYICTYIT